MEKKINSYLKDLLASADIKVNGDRPWDIQVHNLKFYQRVLAGGSLTFGESYMDGWWDSKAIDQLIYKILDSGLYNLRFKLNKEMIFNFLKARVTNLQKRSRAHEIGRKHYDIGNDLYKNMLDRRMNYSCGYWKNAKDLDQAQEAKLDLICRKLGLKKGDKILDIGCGWGSFAKYAAEKYKSQVVGITVSKEQVKLARELCENLPIQIRLQDYRDLNEKFDCIVSIGMFEHVGYKNYKNFMKAVNKNLKDKGIFLLHTIGRNRSLKSADPWISKYIFPNSMLPSARQITEASEVLILLEDLHSFGHDYDKTLMSWHQNFNNSWYKIKDNYSQRFYRMWNYYLLSSAGAFRANDIRLWQIVFSKNGTKETYKSIR
nr:cyclopropane fatty acyl phospholipid synthase [Candidatus Woesearchaeota archaeon]